jgi:hypothetical protein
VSPELRAKAELRRLEREIRSDLDAMQRQRERIEHFSIAGGREIEPVARWSTLIGWWPS